MPGHTIPFDDQDLLASSGRLDSFNTVQLIVFLEQEVGLDLSDMEFDIKDFDSVDSIMAMVDKINS